MAGKARGHSGTLFRYVAAEASLSFFVSFLFFFFIFFVNQILLMAEDILSKRAPPDQVVLLILYSLPVVVAMAAPFASLVGILMAVGRMSSDNEVLIMRTSGLSYRVVFVPILVVGLAVSLLSFLANDILLPAGTLEWGKVYRNLLLSTPSVELESDSVKKYEDTVMVTGRVRGTSIDKLLIIDRTEDGDRRVIVARDAVLREGKGAGLELDLRDAFLHSAKEGARADYDYSLAGSLTYSVRPQDLVQSFATPSAREMSSVDVRREIRRQREAVAARADESRRRAFLAAVEAEKGLRASSASPERNAVPTSFRRLEASIAELADTENDRTLRIYELEYYKKFSIPFGALAFVFLAVPLGLMTRKSGQSVGFGVGLIIAVVYWALLLGGQTLGVRLGYSPFWAMWLPNALVAAAGLALAAARLAR